MATRPKSFRNEVITASVVQQGTGNAGRDIYNGELCVPPLCYLTSLSEALWLTFF